MDWVDLIFSSSGFVARHHCGDWSRFFITLYIVGNAATWLAYMAIGGVLLHVKPKEVETFGPIPQRERRLAAIVFASSIIVCGGGHLLDGCGAFVAPAYHLFAIYHCLTAAISWTAVAYVVRYRDRILVGM